MSVRITQNKITPSLGRIRAKMDKLPKRAFVHWKKITPKKTGNAKRKTKLNRNVIEANYPYAQRLDEGYSKQAPRGMLEPTLKYVKTLLKGKILRK
jgi:hypothetical protein